MEKENRTLKDILTNPTPEEVEQIEQAGKELMEELVEVSKEAGVITVERPFEVFGKTVVPAIIRVNSPAIESLPAELERDIAKKCGATGVVVGNHWALTVIEDPEAFDFALFMELIRGGYIHDKNKENELNSVLNHKLHAWVRENDERFEGGQ